MASPGRPSPAPGHDAAAARSAALKGATLAFQAQKTAADGTKPPLPAPRTPNPTRSTGNGALLAATQASRERSGSGTRSPTNSIKRNTGAGSREISRQGTGGSVQDGGGGYGRELEPRVVTQRLSQYLSSSPAGSPHLLSPGGRSSLDPRSTSFIAATLAASRSASPTPNHTGHTSPHPAAQQAAHSPLAAKPKRRRSFGSQSVDSSTMGPDVLDTSPIPAATSLISMFENKGDTDPIKKRDPSPNQRLAARPKLRPPTPPRSLSPRGQDDAEHRSTSKAAAPKPAPKPKLIRAQRPVTPPQVVRRVATEVASPEPRRIGLKPILNPPGLPLRSSSSSSSLVPRSGSDTRRPRPPTPKKETKPPTSKQRVRTGRPTTSSSQDSASSNDTFVSASSTQSPRPGSPVRAEMASTSEAESLRPPLQQLNPARQTLSVYSNSPRLGPSPSHSTTTVDSSSSLPLDSLTSAIMAGNLAAARHTPNPTKPPVPPTRRSGHHHHQQLQQQRTGDGATHGRKGSTSPQRRPGGGMLQTLRQPPSKSDNEDEDARRRSHRHRKKPLGKKHAHHEGARKRWRDEVSAREKKRYEAVWASNRGLFISDFADAGGDADRDDLVANVVVRDIWSRSRLPVDELAEVWDLVDRKGAGALNKQEFVVGMWLVDQRLRGRKIPARVSDSVWDSARGVRVAGPKRK